jgi:colanic acid biosynthesis glycosyl transferase WcaI
MTDMAIADALLITQYYRPEPIGSGPFCGDLAEWISQNGRHVTVLTSFPHYPTPKIFATARAVGSRREIINGVGVQRLANWIPRRTTALRRITSEGHFLLLGLLALLTRRTRRQTLVLSLCPSILSVALGAIAKSRDGRHVALVHDIQSGLASGLGMVRSPRLLRAMRWCERVVLNRVDLIVVLSREMQEQLRSIGVTTPIDVVPIWVDADRIRPVARAADGRVTVLYSGNLGRKQGLDQVIALAAELQERGADVEIVVRGNGGEAQRLASDIATQGLANIRMAELIPQESLSDALALGDIHLVPQDPEAADFAVPSKVYNIMAAGRPFVATARPGSSLWRLCEACGGFLCVPPNDRQAFADTVLRLAGDAGLRATLGARGRRYVERHQKKADVLGHLVSLIDEL